MTQTQPKKRGRKPVDDKQIPINLWFRRSIIDRFGGDENFKMKIIKFISEEIEIQNRKKSVLL